MVGMEQYTSLALQQTLSPQMQQSLALLQAPLAELRQLVDAELRKNPTLEEVVPEKQEDEPRKNTTELEDQWSNYYIQRPASEYWTREALERREHFLESQVRPPTLQEHLLEQLLIGSWPENETQIAKEIIGNLDEHGYLRASVQDIAFTTGSDPSQVERVLEKVQEFDPPGVASRSLGECLLLQLQQKGRRHSCEARIVQYHLDELGRKKLPEIAKTMGVPLCEIQRAAEVIAELDPRPGRAFSSDLDQIIIPEVIVERDGDGYHVHLNNEEIPKLRITDSYKDMLPNSSREVREYLRERFKEGKFFMRSIQQRQQTILSISQEIVARQKDFLDHGPSHLRPLTMRQVADAVGVHETTVSRAVSGKYMATPQGLFEMKYFFSHGYTNNDGESVSNESVRQAIQMLIREENPNKPYSDQDMVEMLAGRGLVIARRTVAKYREQLGILPRHLRKSF